MSNPKKKPSPVSGETSRAAVMRGGRSKPLAGPAQTAKKPREMLEWPYSLHGKPDEVTTNKCPRCLKAVGIGAHTCVPAHRAPRSLDGETQACPACGWMPQLEVHTCSLRPMTPAERAVVDEIVRACEIDASRHTPYVQGLATRIKQDRIALAAGKKVKRG